MVNSWLAGNLQLNYIGWKQLDVLSNLYNRRGAPDLSLVTLRTKSHVEWQICVFQMTLT